MTLLLSSNDNKNSAKSERTSMQMFELQKWERRLCNPADSLEKETGRARISFVQVVAE